MITYKLLRCKLRCKKQLTWTCERCEKDYCFNCDDKKEGKLNGVIVYICKPCNKTFHKILDERRTRLRKQIDLAKTDRFRGID